MQNKKAVLRVIGTVVSSLVILGLAVCALIFGDKSLSANQLGTLNILLIILVAAIAYCFIVGEITQNFSQMDKLWSLLPIAYSWVIAIRGGMKLRLLVTALIVTAWGVRLTMNFARKGAYKLKFWEGREDYRWSIVRSSPVFRHKFAWTLFDLFFISIYQNVLVLAICLPALAAMDSVTPVGVFDFIGAALALLFFVLETVSDEYQWRFHEKKKELLAKEGALEKLPAPYDLGFNTSGPWARMRHPNYLGEQGIWLSLYLLVIGAKVARFGIFHWSLIGPLFLCLLFMGSSALGEKISSGKYPAYTDYVDQVFKYLPLRKYRRKQ